MTDRGEFDCGAAREAIHAMLDVDLVDAGPRRSLEAHLFGCSECRELAADLRAVQHGLQRLPEAKLPDEVLEEVWLRTVRAGRRPWARPRFFAAAAAAALVLALGGLWLRDELAPGRPSDQELERAAREARIVLRLTSEALHKTEHAAFGDVLAGEVSDALRSVPIRWPEREDAQRRGS